MTTTHEALREAVEALKAQHADRLRYSLAKQRANSTCGDFKASPLSELIESGYMQGLGKQTAAAIHHAEEALEVAKRLKAMKQPPTYDTTKWRLVPVEPTPEMRLKGQECLPGGIPGRAAYAADAYHAMLEAAPQPPEQPEAAGVAVVESSQPLHLGGFRIRAKSDQPMPVGAALHLHATAPPARVDGRNDPDTGEQRVTPRPAPHKRPPAPQPTKD